jgi:hypothetical protein
MKTKKYFKKILALLIIILSVSQVSNAQKETRSRKSVPVVNIPITTTKDSPTVKTYLNKIDPVKINAAIQLAVPTIAVTGMISMPENAYVGDKENLIDEMEFRLLFIDSNNLIESSFKLKYSFIKLNATDLIKGRIGALYTISNMPINRKVSIRLYFKEPKNFNIVNTPIDNKSIVFPDLNQSNFNVNVELGDYFFFPYRKEAPISFCEAVTILTKNDSNATKNITLNYNYSTDFKHKR